MFILGPLMSTILWRLASCTIFPIFLENKSRSELNKYTTFINSSWGISEQKMREINFSSMCHIFVISRGLPGHSLLSSLIARGHVQLVKKDRRRFDVCYHAEMKPTLSRTYFKFIRRHLDLTFALGLIHSVFEACVTHLVSFVAAY